jgi:hypothetical protein
VSWEVPSVRAAHSVADGLLMTGVDPRNTEQGEETHGRGIDVDDRPSGGGDRRKNVGWMDRLDARENDPCRHS